jgi:long-chain acyl-CoA synthetase
MRQLLIVYRLKLKRPQTAKVFRQHLDDCYEEALAEESKPKAKL